VQAIVLPTFMEYENG